MRRRTFLIRILLFIFALLLAGLAAEVGMRLYGRATGTDFTLYSRELSRSDRLPDGLLRDEGGLTVLGPGARVLAITSDFKVRYEINAHGMRGKERALKGKGERSRILVLGDSFTFGEGVPLERTFTSLLEERLGADLFNLGVPGYGAGQALALYLRRQSEIDHDMVLFFFAATLYRRRHLELDDPSLGLQRPAVYISPDHPLLNSDPWATDLSYLVSYLHFHYQVWALSKHLEQNDREEWGREGGRMKRDTRRSELSFPGLDARTSRILGRIAATARKGGKRLVVVNIEPGVTFPIFPGLKEELTYIDLSEDLRRAADERSLRFKYDRHYNPGTHRLIAEALAPRLAALMNKRLNKKVEKR